VVVPLSHCERIVAIALCVTSCSMITSSQVEFGDLAVRGRERQRHHDVVDVVDALGASPPTATFQLPRPAPAAWMCRRG
jgi:hypothetical protein